MSSKDRLAKLELKQLRVFQALIREQNLSRVADQMNVSQQSISEQLKRLRDIFSDRLFIRTSNGVIPTPLTDKLAPKVTSLLLEVETLLETDHFDPAQADGVFHISATDFEQRVILPNLLKQVREQAPKLKIAVHQLKLDKLAQQLMLGEIDLVLSTPDFVPQNYPTLHLYHESYVCVASKQSKVSRKTVTATDIAPLPQLVVSPSRADLRGMVDQWFELQGVSRNIVLSVPSFAAAIDLMAQTDILAFLPSRLLPDERLSLVKLKEHPPGFDVIAAWHVRSGQDALHQWIRSLLGSFHTK